MDATTDAIRYYAEDDAIVTEAPSLLTRRMATLASPTTTRREEVPMAVPGMITPPRPLETMQVAAPTTTPGHARSLHDGEGDAVDLRQRTIQQAGAR